MDGTKQGLSRFKNPRTTRGIRRRAILKTTGQNGSDGPESSRLIRNIVDQLPDLQKRIIWADACSPEGIADSAALAKELNIPIGTVRVYRKRAKDKIRTEMQSAQPTSDST